MTDLLAKIAGVLEVVDDRRRRRLLTVLDALPANLTLHVATANADDEKLREMLPLPI